VDLTAVMTGSPASETVEAEPVGQPSLAASETSTLPDPWSEDEDDDDDDGGGSRNSLELVSASKELARDAVAADEDDEEDFDLVNSRDLRSSSPVSIVSTSSRDVVPIVPLPQPTAVTPSAEAEDLVNVLRQEEHEGATRMQPDTDTESWRSSSSASDCSVSIGGGTSATKSSASVSGSESLAQRRGRPRGGRDEVEFPGPDRRFSERARTGDARSDQRRSQRTWSRLLDVARRHRSSACRCVGFAGIVVVVRRRVGASFARLGYVPPIVRDVNLARQAAFVPVFAVVIGGTLLVRSSRRRDDVDVDFASLDDY
jgi:hypothetical protein